VASHATTINAVPASEGRQQGMYSSTGTGSKACVCWVANGEAGASAA